MSGSSRDDGPTTTLAWPDVVYDLQEILRDLPHPVYIVGGAVRDAYLRRPIKDLDLATAGGGIKLARTIANALGGDFYPLDTSRDVGRAILTTPEGRLVIDAAQFRGGGLDSDLADRDFTLNAMAVDLSSDLNVVIDPLGGLADLRSRLLRLCAPDALEVDPIRCLRAVRQSVQFGLRLEAQTLNAIRRTRDRLDTVSPERVRDECFKLLSLSRPVAALRIMRTLELLSELQPTTDDPDRSLRVIEHLVAIWNVISPVRSDDSVGQFAYGMLAIQLGAVRAPLYDALSQTYGAERTQRSLLLFEGLLGGCDPETCDALSDRLRLSNVEKDRVRLAVDAARRVPGVQRDALSVYRYWRDYGDAGLDGVLLALATARAAGLQIEHDEWLGQVELGRHLLEAYLLRRAQAVEPPALIDGTELMRRFGLRPGPIIRELLDHIREGQVEGTIMTLDDAVNAGRRYLERKVDPSA